MDSPGSKFLSHSSFGVFIQLWSSSTPLQLPVHFFSTLTPLDWSPWYLLQRRGRSSEWVSFWGNLCGWWHPSIVNEPQGETSTRLLWYLTLRVNKDQLGEQEEEGTSGPFVCGVYLYTVVTHTDRDKHSTRTYCTFMSAGLVVFSPFGSGLCSYFMFCC